MYINLHSLCASEALIETTKNLEQIKHLLKNMSVKRKDKYNIVWFET